MPDHFDLWKDDPGWPVDVDIILDSYWNYRRHKMLPAAGGWFDQDTHILESFKLMDAQVEWIKQKLQERSGLPTIEDIYSKRRKHHQGDD